MRIPICKPYLDEAELRAVSGVLESGWLMQGSQVKQFEQSVSDYVGSGFAVATSSCSTALHLAVRACGLQSGDEVILPSLTWIATAAAVEACGAKPVFCDIDQRTFNLDPDLVESLITPRTKAVIAVNLFGLAADLPRLTQLCCRHGLYLIEDAACSLGARIGARHSGTFGRFGCFSFHPRKSITTGEGGMIVGGCAQDAELLRSLRSHGYSVTGINSTEHSKPFDLGDFDQLGYNYRLTDIQAALGITQMAKLDSIIKRKREIAATYSRALADLEGILTPYEPDNYYHTYQSYVVMVGSASQSADRADLLRLRRNDIMLELEGAGIATRPGTHAVHTLAYYKKKYRLATDICPNASAVMNQSIALPLYPSMTEAEIEFVIERFRAAVLRANVREFQAQLSY